MVVCEFQSLYTCYLLEKIIEVPFVNDVEFCLLSLFWLDFLPKGVTKWWEFPKGGLVSW